MRIALPLLLVALAATSFAPRAQAHCEIPCGIYNDQMRIVMLLEHTETIAKSMRQIEALGAASPVNHNQLVRWVTNKEKHAEELQDIVTQYFLTQRIKPDMAGAGGGSYEDMLATLHGMLVGAMKCKQTTDVEQTEKLSTLIRGFARMYFAEEDRAHMDEHHGG